MQPKVMLNNALRAIVAAWLEEGMAAGELSVTDLARQSKVSRDTIYGILSRERSAEEDTLTKLSEAIGRPLPDLTIATEAPSSPPEARSQLDRLLVLERRLRLFRLQLQGYAEAEVQPGPAVIAAWLELLADLEDAKNGG